ncbi:RHS repeat-associated core domain-containing protein [Paraflavitalea speifideaquila]|uniref:RHS repeat-associated core domain-containing protein n=1 Tax=Paraflavitalea speifideaquila TaxID=3076558 RepID=UPI0028E2BC08|nr:RHS repeat-associated core domain-containing protein [Paraflavitalea speifideiaquila]
MVSSSGGKVGLGDVTGIGNALSPNVVQFLNGRSYDNTKPKAYLNWILFDNQFNYVASNSGVQQVQPGSSKQALVAPLQSITRNGYLYVYVSNESQQDVYFDDLNVKHYTGPLVQEQSYYPFGLQMAAISDKALLKQTTAEKFNGGTELEEDFGLNYYNTLFRKYDPQIGRFNGIDILAEQTFGINPYQFGFNNPLTYNDPTGALTQKELDGLVKAFLVLLPEGIGVQ